MPPSEETQLIDTKGKQMDKKCPNCGSTRYDMDMSGMCRCIGCGKTRTGSEETVDNLKNQLAVRTEERDNWHRVVVDCERVLECPDTAASPTSSNLVNLCRDQKQALVLARADNAVLRKAIIGIQQIMNKYLPPDGMDPHEAISQILDITDREPFITMKRPLVAPDNLALPQQALEKNR
jgi:ribosomal protein L37AE/L43A